MKNKNLSFSIAIILLTSLIFSMVVSVRADYSYNYSSTYFNYDVVEGDIFEYNTNFFFNFSASNTFYDEMDLWITNMSTTENNTLEDFSSEMYINDLKDFLELDYKLQIQITEMYQGIYSEINSDGTSETYNRDIINASLQADLNEGNGWESPVVVEIDKLEDSKTFMANYLNETQYEEYETIVNMTINNTQDPANQPNWANMEVSSLNSSVRSYYENGTLIETELRELDNGTIEPVRPFSDFGVPGVGVPLLFPTEMNFNDFYNYSKEMFKFDLLYKLENNETIAPLNSTDTLQSLMTDQGITNLYVDQKSVGIVWNIENLTTNFISFFVLDDSTSNNTMGIADSVGSLSIAVEYDDVWALNTFAVYAHIGLTANTTGLEGAPDLDMEEISLDFTYIIAREGVKPPTEEDILEGKIGENSPFEIPGFPALFIGLFGLISVSALIIKHRK
ncbi:hypothetical protein DSAG12_00178 [Promethearchaeum syntrophicum]|uniref:Uncharacterized protein n=1 Tax=Promethearchaeum syntrophicum TaxID=2594042 RepID=A0A5B9D5R5_9ARCH|nr:hypothetical protein [Candidatus Prometheoarchaeum syntrophicum]